MLLTVYLAYVATVAILVITPGPSVTLGIAHAAQFGWRRVAWTAFGDITANVIQMSLAILGLGLVLAQSATAFMVLKVLGVCYLVYLGVHLLRSGGIEPDTGEDYQALSRKTAMWHWRSGFIVAATSPKAILFFAAFFPQFITPEADLLPQFLLLAGTFVVMDYGAVMIYAYLTSAAKKRLANSQLINRLSGGALLAAAAALAATSSNAASRL